MKKIELDENFPPSFLSLFQNEIIDASSVHLQGISGTDDDTLYEICKAKGRTIVTFDLDFANIIGNIIRYPASHTAGISVCRLRKKISLDYIRWL